MFGAVSAMPTVASPLGGVAFDSTAGDQLEREQSAYLRQMPDFTLAFWWCPSGLAGGHAAAIRGISQTSVSLGYSTESDPLKLLVGDGGEVEVADHVEGDWYLLAWRADSAALTQKITLTRLRDGAVFEGQCGEGVGVLNGEADYFFEGMLAAVCFGSSWHWSVLGRGYYDRMGIWNRALTEDNLADLFNLGLGWMPGS